MALAAAYPNGHLLLASPVETGARLWQLGQTAPFWLAVGGSATRILGGFLLACALAIPCAALAARFVSARELLAPLTAVMRAVPVASFIILAFLWLPSKGYLALFIAFLMVFPVAYGNILAGILQVDGQLLEMTEVFCVPVWRRVKHLYIPQVLPWFRTACSLGLGLCWKAGVAAEVIGVVQRSLGEQLYNAKIYFETADLFAWTVVIVALSALFEKLFLGLLDALVKGAKL